MKIKCYKKYIFPKTINMRLTRKEDVGQVGRAAFADDAFYSVVKVGSRVFFTLT